MTRSEAFARIDAIKQAYQEECKAAQTKPDKNMLIQRVCDALGIARAQFDAGGAGVVLYARQKLLGPSKAQVRKDPDALRYARTYPMWLAPGCDTLALDKLSHAYTDLYNLVARNYQDELGRIRAQYAAGNTSPSFARLNLLKHDMKDFVMSHPHVLPAEMLRTLYDRLHKSVAGAGKGDKGWDGGYPQVKDGIEPSIRLYFNGNNLEMGDWSAQQSGSNSYMSIGAQHDPKNHHGRRTGRRAQRQLRRVEATLPRPGRDRSDNPIRIAWDVLIHDPERLPGKIKGAMIISERQQWSVCFQLEDGRPQVRNGSGKVCGINIGWRSRGDGSLAVVHVHDGSRHEAHPVSWKPSRTARRQGRIRAISDLPTYMPTPEGEREYRRQQDERKDAMKQTLT